MAKFIRHLGIKGFLKALTFFIFSFCLLTLFIHIQTQECSSIEDSSAIISPLFGVSLQDSLFNLRIGQGYVPYDLDIGYVVRPLTSSTCMFYTCRVYDTCYLQPTMVEDTCAHQLPPTIVGDTCYVTCAHQLPPTSKENTCLYQQTMVDYTCYHQPEPATVGDTCLHQHTMEYLTCYPCQPIYEKPIYETLIHHTETLYHFFDTHAHIFDDERTWRVNPGQIIIENYYTDTINIQQFDTPINIQDYVVR